MSIPPSVLAELKRWIDDTLTKQIPPCPMCGATSTVFKDEVSEVEHRISGMCQKCQDRTYADIAEMCD